MGKHLRIGEVASLADLQVSAVRYYESLGLMPTAHRVNNQRRYDRSVLERLTFIRVAQRVGFTLTEIGILLNRFDTDAAPAALCRELAQQKLLEIDSLIVQAQSIKRTLEQSLYCRCMDLQQCTHTLNAIGS